MNLSGLSGSDLESYSDDDDCVFIDQSSAHAALTPFDALTAGSDDGGDFGDEYETQMRQALHALLEQADAELYNEGGGISTDTECRRWRRGFCHMAVRGRAAAAPVAADHAYTAVEPVSSSSRAADHCVLPVACAAASLELELVGRQCVPTAPQLELECGEAPPAHLEEVLAWHGVHEETLAAHVTGGPDAAAASRKEWSRLSRFGLPPREPTLAMVDSVLSRLVTACWRALQPALAAVPRVTAHVLARLAPLPGDRALRTSFKRASMVHRAHPFHKRNHCEQIVSAIRVFTILNCQSPAPQKQIVVRSHLHERPDTVPSDGVAVTQD